MALTLAWPSSSEKPFLHAPNPHDPASTLAHTVTGDYASPATWGEVRAPPWRQPRGKYMVSSVDSHSNAASRR